MTQHITDNKKEETVNVWYSKFGYPKQEIYLFKLPAQYKHDPKYRVDWKRNIGIGCEDVRTICKPSFRYMKDARKYIKGVMKGCEWTKII